MMHNLITLYHREYRQNQYQFSPNIVVRYVLHIEPYHFAYVCHCPTLVRYKVRSLIQAQRSLLVQSSRALGRLLSPEAVFYFICGAARMSMSIHESLPFVPVSPHPIIPAGVIMSSSYKSAMTA